MPKVSIIIPVYNVEALLERSLSSVTSQTLSDIEIICIDDCSTDRSLSILKSWEHRDPRIRLFSLPQNEGLSRARNVGMDAARSPYIYFLDSDDWIDVNYLEVMYARAIETGQYVVVNSSILKEYEDSKINPVIENWGFTNAEYYPSSYVQSHMLCVVCARLFKRDYLVSNNIRFPSTRYAGEDISFSGLADLLQTNSFVFKGPFYHYWQRKGSLSHTEERGFDYIRNYRLLYHELVTRSISLDGVKLFYCDFLNIDSQEKFDYIWSYLNEAGPAIFQQRDLYTVLENRVFDAVISCSNYESFRTQHHSNIAIEYLRSRLKK
jgi:glycosyltransferase involved in cell wall biosynthesis